MAGHSFKLQKLQSSISHISTTHLTPLFHQIITTPYLPLKNRVKEVMNWGTNKTVRKMKDCSEPKSGNAQRKWISKGRVHDEDDDELFWRISFSKETYEDVETICNSDYRLDVSSVSSGDFKKTSNGRTIREFIAEESQFQSNNLLEEHKLKTGEVGSTEFSENKPKIVIQEKSVDNLKSLLNSDLQTVVEGYEFEDSEVKNVKIDEVMLKNEKQRRRSKKGRKVKAYSPKISFEDMKKTRMKMEEMSAFRISVGSIAVVKSSFDPERDFGDSMMEMMIEKGIRPREELEELLACYLTLNCDEYHALIIKVFKQTYNKFVNL